MTRGSLLRRAVGAAVAVVAGPFAGFATARPATVLAASPVFIPVSVRLDGKAIFRAVNEQYDQSRKERAA